MAAAVVLASATSAQAQIYKTVLSGANEIPAVTTGGGGTGIVTINATTHEMRIKASFGNLNGNTTSAHIHCCVAVAPGNAGVATTTPTFAGFPTGVRQGSYDTTFNMGLTTSWNAAYITANGGTPASAEAALFAGINNGQAYLNIHSSTNGGGEIRGNLVRYSFANAASNSRVRGLASSLDSLGAGTGALNERLVSLAELEGAGLVNALTTVQPLSAAATSSIANNNLFNDYDQIGNRLGGLRGDAAGGGVWIRYAEHENERELGTSGAMAESDGWDVLGGIDAFAYDNWTIGASLGISEDDISYNRLLRGGSGSIEGWRGTVYAEMKADGFFLDGMVSMGEFDTDAIRAVLGSVATSQTDAEQWGGRVAAGMDWDLGSGFSLTPQARLDWSSFDVDGYRETGSNGMALNVASTSVDSMRASVGGQLDWAMSANVKPYFRAFLAQEMEDDDVETSASFLAGGSAFTSTDAGVDSTTYLFSVGVNVIGSETFGAAVSFDHTNNDNFQSDSLQAKAHWRF